MMISKWLSRKSFDEAAAKAQEIRRNTQEKKERNSGLFTAAQENLRRELRLHDRPTWAHQRSATKCQNCGKSPELGKPSRGRLRIKRK